MRLATGFGLILSMMLILTVVGISRVSLINTNITQITDVNSVKQRYAINFRGSVHDRAIAIRDIVLLSEQSSLNTVLNNIIKLDEFYQTSSNAMAKLIAQMTSEERRLISEIDNIEQRTQPYIQQIINAKKKGGFRCGFANFINGCSPCFHSMA